MFGELSGPAPEPVQGAPVSFQGSETLVATNAPGSGTKGKGGGEEGDGAAAGGAADGEPLSKNALKKLAKAWPGSLLAPSQGYRQTQVKGGFHMRVDDIAGAGNSRYRSPRHTMPINSSNEDSRWRAICVCPQAKEKEIADKKAAKAAAGPN
jgi:hypothetical protein